MHFHFLFQSLNLAIILAGNVLASPLVVRNNAVTLPFARRVNLTGAATILEVDQARAKFLKNRPKAMPRNIPASSAAFGIPSTNQAVEYVVNVGVGTPPTTYSLLVDTGSSNTWVGADVNKGYTPTNSSIDTGNEVIVEYGSGIFIGEEFLDTVTLAPHFVIHNQSIGVAELSDGFNGVDGIIGIGPQDLTCGTTFPDESCIPTVTDNAFSQGLIHSPIVGISFEPPTDLDVTNGEISFGALDVTKMKGTMQDVPLTTTSPANLYVGIDQTITYGVAKTPILAKTAGISDTGTTLLLIASDALAVYQNKTGAVFDPTVGLLRLSPDQFSNVESLFFTIGRETYEFTANAQAWPRTLNTAIGGTSDFVYLIVGDLGTDSGEGFDFINGMTFLERFYTYFDSGASSFGIAKTKFTFATSN